jgi:hypothetical protein
MTVYQKKSVGVQLTWNIVPFHILQVYPLIISTSAPPVMGHLFQLIHSQALRCGAIIITLQSCQSLCWNTGNCERCQFTQCHWKALLSIRILQNMWILRHLVQCCKWAGQPGVFLHWVGLLPSRMHMIAVTTLVLLLSSSKIHWRSEFAWYLNAEEQ